MNINLSILWLLPIFWRYIMSFSVVWNLLIDAFVSLLNKASDIGSILLARPTFDFWELMLIIFVLLFWVSLRFFLLLVNIITHHGYSMCSACVVVVPRFCSFRQTSVQFAGNQLRGFSKLKWTMNLIIKNSPLCQHNLVFSLWSTSFIVYSHRPWEVR